MAKNIVPNTWKAVKRGASWVVEDRGGKTVAVVRGTDSNEAYAKLVAAGPYMLEALKAVAAIIGDEDLPDNGELSGAAVSDMVRGALEIVQ